MRALLLGLMLSTLAFGQQQFSGSGTGRLSGSGVTRNAIDLPPQPTAGPGGSTYATTMDTYGPYNDSAGGTCSAAILGGQLDQGRNYWLFMPHGLTVAPVMNFLHGYGLTNPLLSYPDLIKHVVRKGYIVTFVQYGGNGTAPAAYPSEYMLGEGDALKCLWSNTSLYTQPVKADGVTACTQATYTTCVVGAFSHSVGSWLNMIVASKAAANALPPVLAMVAIEPVIPSGVTCSSWTSGTCDVSGISSSAKLLVVIGDQDLNTSCPNLTGSGSTVCRACMAADEWTAVTTLTAGTNKFFLLGNSQTTHGDVPSLFDHNFSLTTATETASQQSAFYPLNGTDFYSTFKWVVSAAETLTGNTADINSVFSAGNALQIGLGNWTDGTAVTPLSYLTAPTTISGLTGGACN